MARIYVASSWRNTIQPRVVEELSDCGHKVYDFRNPPSGSAFSWEQLTDMRSGGNHIEWRGRDIPKDPQFWTAEEYRLLVQTHPTAAAGYMSDMRAMEWADVCVLVLPCGRSAHLECGWFAGRGKRSIILTQDGEEPELMALMATDICVNMKEVHEALQSSDFTALPLYN